MKEKDRKSGEDGLLQSILGFQYRDLIVTIVFKHRKKQAEFARNIICHHPLVKELHTFVHSVSFQNSGYDSGLVK